MDYEQQKKHRNS